MIAQKPFISITFLSLTLGALFYFFVPTAWEVTLDWKVTSMEPVTKDKVVDYHESWLSSLQDKNILNHIEQQECVLDKQVWSCQYFVYQFSILKDLITSAQKDFPNLTAWIDPLDAKKELVNYEEQRDALSAKIASIDLELNQIKAKANQQEKTMQKTIDQRDLLEQAISLRQQQLNVLTDLLPLMDQSSQLYQVYQQERNLAQDKIKTHEKKLTQINRTLSQKAAQWLKAQELENQKHVLSMDLLYIQTQMDRLNTAFSITYEGKVAHPKGYAITLKQDHTALNRSLVNASSFGVLVFFLLSNFWLWTTHRIIRPEPRMDPEKTKASNRQT